MRVTKLQDQQFALSFLFSARYFSVHALALLIMSFTILLGTCFFKSLLYSLSKPAISNPQVASGLVECFVLPSNLFNFVFVQYNDITCLYIDNPVYHALRTGIFPRVH